jgi:hypothetical protein
MTFFLIYADYNPFNMQVEFTYRQIGSREVGDRFIADMKHIGMGSKFRVATGEELAQAKLQMHNPPVKFIAGPPFTVLNGYGQ